MSGRRVVRLVAEWLRGVSGMPDYDAYVRHVEQAHPGTAPVSRREYFDQHLLQRYSGVTRCC